MSFKKLLFLLALVLFATSARTAPSVALHYGTDIPIEDLRIFDILVVEPDHGHRPEVLRQTGTEPFAYVSVAEVQASRPYYKDIPAQWKMARNGEWNAEVIDQTPADWPNFFAERVIGPLWQKGYRGFFLDTLDSYRLAKNFDEAAQQAGLIKVIETLHKRYPGIRLILNRGFEIVPNLRGKIEMVAAESLYRRWNAGQKRYEAVPEADREWLLGQMKKVRDESGIPVLAIDYVAPTDRELTRETADRIKADGFTPWVTDWALTSVGIGQFEPVPRRILIIYDSAESPALRYSNAHRFLQMPLNHHGYVVDYLDARQPLPTHIGRDRYAAIATWFSGQLPEQAGRRLGQWIQARIKDGLPVAMIGDLGYSLTPAQAGNLGLILQPETAQGELVISRQHTMLGLEKKPQAQRNEIPPFRLRNESAGENLVELSDQAGKKFTAGAILPWGGFILDPFAVEEVPGTGRARWSIDPFAFLIAALKLEQLPIPDVTTENGRRLFFSHIDGDGFPSLAEFPGSPLAAQVLLSEILEKYRIPTTMSVIEGETAPHGLFPKLSPQLEDIARRMFRLPHVEIASHTYAHPYLWNVNARHGLFLDDPEAEYHLEIPGYKMDLTREIIGSIEYIKTRLAPPGKPVTILLWSGDTAPGTDAMKILQRAGLLNMNGGDTSISHANPTLTAIGAHGLLRDGLLQVYAPITNENIYTNLWRGPYYGYERVIESFTMTGHPRRIKPVDIYYHTYSASKRAGLKAVQKALDWALKQPLHPVFASEYIRKVQDFHSLALAREGKFWRVRSNGELRTLRLPAALGRPKLDSSTGVAGFFDGPEGKYIHMTGQTASFETTQAPTAEAPYLAEANARLNNWNADQRKNRIEFILQGHVALQFALGASDTCRVQANNRAILPARSEAAAQGTLRHFRLNDVTAKIRIDCPAR